MIDYLGWAATAVFVASYFCPRADEMRRVQMVGAVMWIIYGSLLQAYPVVVANLLVFGAATWTSKRSAPPTSARDSGSTAASPLW